MRAVLSPEDLKRGDLVEPGWYEAIISKYEEAVTKGTTARPSDGSTNAIFSIKLEEGPNKGAEMKRFFNEKALGFGKNLYAALGFPKNATGGYDLSTELFQQTVGAKLRVYIKRGVNADNQKEFNEVADFQPSKLL